MTSIHISKILNAPELHISIFAFLLNFVWELLLVKTTVVLLPTLLLDVALDHLLTAMTTHRRDKIARRPKLAAPEQLTHLGYLA